MDIICRSQEMSPRFHRPLEAVIPNLSAPGRIFAVPSMRRPSMKSSQPTPQLLNLFRGHQYVVMIRQNTPEMCGERKLMTSLQERFLAFGHPLGTLPNNLRMFVTSCRNQILMSSFEVQMWRRMPWQLARSPYVESMSPIFCGHLSPVIHVRPKVDCLVNAS